MAKRIVTAPPVAILEKVEAAAERLMDAQGLARCLQVTLEGCMHELNDACAAESVARLLVELLGEVHASLDPVALMKAVQP